MKLYAGVGVGGAKVCNGSEGDGPNEESIAGQHPVCMHSFW